SGSCSCGSPTSPRRGPSSRPRAPPTPAGSTATRPRGSSSSSTSAAVDVRHRTGLAPKWAVRPMTGAHRAGKVAELSTRGFSRGASIQGVRITVEGGATVGVEERIEGTQATVLEHEEARVLVLQAQESGAVLHTEVEALLEEMGADKAQGEELYHLLEDLHVE